MNYWDCMCFLVAFVNLGGGELKGIHGRAYAHLKGRQLDKVGRRIRFDSKGDVLVMGWLRLSQLEELNQISQCNQPKRGKAQELLHFWKNNVIKILL